MARKKRRRIQTLRGREIHWDAVDDVYGRHATFCLDHLARSVDVAVELAESSHHIMVEEGDGRLPLPVFARLLGFYTRDPYGGIATIETEEALTFLREHWFILDDYRCEVEFEYDHHGIPQLRAWGDYDIWGRRATFLWHVFGTGDRPLEGGSVTLWLGKEDIYSEELNILQRYQMSVSAEWGEPELEGSLPGEVIEAVGIEPTDPDSFYEFLLNLCPELNAADLGEVWPEGPTGPEGSRRVRQWLDS